MGADQDTRRPGYLAALGLMPLGDDECAHVAADRAQRLDELAEVWPLAFAAQAIGCVVTVAIGVASGAWTGLAAAVGVALGVSAGLWTLVAAPRAARWPLHCRTRTIAAGAAMLGGALVFVVWQAATLPPGATRTAAMTAAVAAAVLTALAFHPVRAAMLAATVGAVVVATLLPAALPAAGIGLAFVALLGVLTCRRARLDDAAAAARGAKVTEGILAMRMIAEFESHGAGWFWEADRYGRVTHLSAKVAAAVARSAGDALGQPLVDLFRMDSDAPGTERTLAFHLSSRTSFSDYSVCGRAAGAEERWWSMSGRPVIDSTGRFQGFIGTGTDLTEQRRSEAEITRLALFDGLTGLANRQRLRLSLDNMLASRAGPYRATALLLLDLDRFKAVNDTLGHQAGDVLLKQVSQRLLRDVGEAGLVGRLGGDEFQVLLPGIDDRETLSVLARTIIASLSQPYSVAGTTVTIGCSIGIAIAGRENDDSETLIRNADLALYAAKGDGRGIHRFYSADMLAGAQSRKQLEDDLRHALATGAFHLVYQPVVSTADERITGYEALLRWNHPTRGAVSPADFIPVAEDCGMIAAIGTWALRTACAEAATWPGNVRVAVNVSPIQFADANFPALVAGALAQSGLPPARLELEITEGVFLDETISSDQTFKALKGLGVRLALDDFGTGYSSLGYLRTAPFDKIKIDQSFVRGAAAPGNRNPAIIAAIVTLARTMGMETTAEGVEVQDEIVLVRDLGCTHIQGWVYGKGVLGAEVSRQLGAAEGRAAASGVKTSRSPRTTMLRSARIEIGDVAGDVRIRNISSTGAMIDGVEFDGEARDIDVLIELLEDQMFPAKLRWSHDGRAGLEFTQSFNLERLNQLQSRIRRAG